MNPELVIFDLDGTLTDSAEGIVSSFRHALATVGADAPAPDDDAVLARRLVGPPMLHTLRGMGLGDQAEAAFAAYRADYVNRGWALNRVFDGIPELLGDLRAAGVRLAVATSKAEPTARRILEHFGLDHFFEVIAGASPDGTRAAKADVVAHALAQLAPLPERVLMVGDRSHDVEGAAAHGITTVVVQWGYGTDDFADLEAAHAVTHVSTVEQLREVLTSDRPRDGRNLHVTFVCTGNICRSPMAEKVFTHQLAERGLTDAVRVSSAGTGGWHAGDGADPRAEGVLRDHGYPTSHRAAAFDDDHLSADLIVAMGRDHLQILRDRGAAPQRLRMLRSFDPRSGAHALDVEDPYYGTTADFDDVLAVIEAALPGVHDWVDAALAERGIVVR